MYILSRIPLPNYPIDILNLGIEMLGKDIYMLM